MAYKAQIMIPSFSGEESAYMERAVLSGEIANKGQNIDEFTDLLLSYTRVSHGLLCCNGTAAIHLALKVAGVEEGDYVFCPTYTYCGTAYPILYERAVPVFIDCTPDGTLDPESLKLALLKYKDKLPKAILIVDTYGAPADFDEIAEVLSGYDIPVIVDSAESLGGEYKGKKCGSFGDISIISFSYSKLVTTSMGGAILSDNEEYIKNAAYFANQAKAKSPCYIHKEIGYNYLISNVLAGMGIGNMKRLDELVSVKRNIFKKYKEAFLSYGVRMCSDKEGSSHWYNGIILSNEKADEGVKKLLDAGIEVRNGFNPMHNQAAFAGFDYVTAKNNSMNLFKNTILIPSGPGMSDEIQELVIKEVKNILC